MKKQTVGEMQMAVSPNQSLAIADFMAKPMVDLDGGTLIDVKEHDEIDASDGCKVRVTEYKILSADGREELTRTCRRKLKIECNQSSRRTEITNGREARVEEKTKILYGDIDGFKVPIVRDNSQRLSLDTNNPQDAAISMVLQKTQENFASMLNEQRNQFISMFPDLFSEMRTTPCLFPAPSCTVETIINPDGSQTTRRCSSRAISSHYSKHVTYIDGVKQPEKTQFRAFMEYIGPEGGYKVTLSPDADLSEDEEETTSAISEVPEDQSAFVTVGRADQPKIREGAKTRFDKAWHAAKELVDSERRYVDKLRLLNEVFRKRIVDEKILEKEKISQLFANIASIHKFHEEHLLPALETSCREWHVTRRISDVLRKRAPFLKMYSEYAHNYKRATKVYDECLKKKKRFSQIVQSIEQTPECDHLPLSSHLICPVQRVMRYQLLLQEYKKYLLPSDEDYKDTVAALDLVLDAAKHANEMMRKMDRYKNLLDVQEQLGGSIVLVSPSRELIKKAKVMKLSSSSDRIEERFLFLFNDLLLLASERKVAAFGKYRVRALFDATLTQICEGDNLEQENSFYLRGSDSVAGPSRCVELVVDSQAEKAEWINAVWNVISESVRRSQSFSTPQNADNTSISSTGVCPECDKRESTLPFLPRLNVCSVCHKRICKKCFAQLSASQKSQKMCAACSKLEMSRHTTNTNVLQRFDPLAIAAKDGAILQSSIVRFKGPSNRMATRYFVLRKDFCLYSYNSDKDSRALTMLPVPGCEVKMLGERLSFSIKHMQRVYTITVNDETTQARWMAALDLAANAAIKENQSSSVKL